MQFADVVGQETAKRHLLQYVSENRVPHALLLAGAEGLGGLPLALAFVQYMVCSNRNEADSCGVCAMCNKMKTVRLSDLHLCFPLISGSDREGDLIDLMRSLVKENPYSSEMDWYGRLGDSSKQGNISAKTAEAIIETMHEPGLETDYRFMLIWLPERLHPVAANRLLKMVEEPPMGAHFIFVSHHPEDILPTVLSRLQQVCLSSISAADIASALELQEGFVREEAIEIGRIARGNYGLALQLGLNEASGKYFQLLKELYRMAYSGKVDRMSDWVGRVTGLGREDQKEALRYFSMMLREIYMLNLEQRNLCYLRGEELDFALKLAPYINGRNVGFLLEEYTRAYRHVVRNGHGGLIFTDMVINHFRLISSRRV